MLVGREGRLWGWGGRRGVDGVGRCGARLVGKGRGGGGGERRWKGGMVRGRGCSRDGSGEGYGVRRWRNLPRNNF